jgi:hypothetical protein
MRLRHRSTAPPWGFGLVALTCAAGLWVTLRAEPQELPTFRGGVDFINISATVLDGSGRFVGDLTADDFVVYEDNHPQTLAYFSRDTMPVSLGFAVDTSNSMAGEKIEAARDSLRQFFEILLDEEVDRDEIFVYRFSDVARLVQEWTNNRGLLAVALRRLTPDGGTAMYDAVEAALETIASGRHPKKALVVISDGIDISSRATLADVRRASQASEALVYAIGIDATPAPVRRQSPPPPRLPYPIPGPTPWPGGRSPFGSPGVLPQLQGPSSGGFTTNYRERANEEALRALTDSSGGRTEMVRNTRDLVRATTAIASELSRQYSLAYAAAGVRDGKWHTIRVEIRRPGYTVRARRGYYAN